MSTIRKVFGYLEKIGFNKKRILDFSKNLKYVHQKREDYVTSEKNSPLKRF
jgi:hypothetical protein